MASKAETNIARSLRVILASLSDGAAIEKSADFERVLTGLEFFLPQVLREIHPEWEWESLDGVLPAVARKVGAGMAELVGHCILISDQTVTPLHVRLQVAETADEISWLECRLGEASGGGMTRTPYTSSWPTKKALAAVAQVDSIEWAYRVTFGQERR